MLIFFLKPVFVECLCVTFLISGSSEQRLNTALHLMLNH